MHKLRFASVGAVALAAAAPAMATSYPVTFNSGVYTPSPTPIKTTGTNFVDTFTFTTTSMSTFSGSLTTRQIFDLTTTPATLQSDLDFVSVTIDGLAWTPDAGNNDVLETYQRVSTLLNAGDHVVTVTYNVDTADMTNGASYGGVFNLAVSDVPEPATWAMMLGGFGLVGGAMRRRAKVAFA